MKHVSDQREYSDDSFLVTDKIVLLYLIYISLLLLLYQLANWWL